MEQPEKPEGATDKKALTLIEVIESAPHFSFLTFEEKKELAKYVRPVGFSAGDFIIHESEVMHTLFFVFKGEIEIVKSSAEGDKVVLATLGRGEIIGEAILLPGKHDSTVIVRAKEKVVALGIEQKDFQLMMARNNKLTTKLLLDVLRIVRRRLNDVSNRLADCMTD